MPSAEFELPFQRRLISLTHQELRFFLRRLIRRRAQGSVVDALRGMCEELGGADHAFTSSDSRLQNFMSRRVANFLPGEIPLLQRVILELGRAPNGDPIPNAELRRDLELARADATQREPGISPKSFARMLGLSGRNSRDLGKLSGRYLIFRRLVSTARLVVYYMEIAQPYEHFPAIYETTTCLVRHGRPTNASVSGVLYEAAGFVFAVGRYVGGGSDIRATILEPAHDGTADLCGLRLGLNRGDRKPAAYRIRCVKLPAGGSQPDWKSYAKEYRLNGVKKLKLTELQGHKRAGRGDMNDRFNEYVENFQSILLWLGERPAVEL